MFSIVRAVLTMASWVKLCNQERTWYVNIASNWAGKLELQLTIKYCCVERRHLVSSVIQIACRFHSMMVMPTMAKLNKNRKRDTCDGTCKFANEIIFHNQVGLYLYPWSFYYPLNCLISYLTCLSYIIQELDQTFKPTIKVVSWELFILQLLSKARWGTVIIIIIIIHSFIHSFIHHKLNWFQALASIKVFWLVNLQAIRM